MSETKPNVPDKGAARPIRVVLRAIKCLACGRYFWDLFRACVRCGCPRG